MGLDSGERRGREQLVVELVRPAEGVAARLGRAERAVEVEEQQLRGGHAARDELEDRLACVTACNRVVTATSWKTASSVWRRVPIV